MARYELDSSVGRLTPAERAARGKAARAEVPRESHVVFHPPSGRPDPVGLLEQQAATRVPELAPVPVRPDDKAITQFAVACADQNERDHQHLVDAVKSGRITAEPGV